MTTPEDWARFKYEGSPFFITSVDSSQVDKVIQLTEKGLPSDFALSEVLTKVVIEHFITCSKEVELNRRHRTTPDDLQLYFFGLLAPLLLTKATFLWIFMGESDARAFILGQPEPSEQYRKFKRYLIEGLTLCSQMLRDVKDCRIIVEHTRQQPFYSSVYFRVGVEAAHDALIRYAARVAEGQVRRELGLRIVAD